jgi:RNA polymerase sigma-70 factor (ECF subfamily)
MKRYSSILTTGVSVTTPRHTTKEPGPGDRELFERFLHGENEAFAELFHRHGPRLYLYTLKIVGDRQQAHDIQQDVWERIIRYRAQGKEAPDSPLGLLVRITRNLCINHVRDRKENIQLAAIPEWRQPATTGRELSELEEAVVIALERLPADQREVLILNAYSGYRFEEIAGMLGEAESTVRTRAWRARARLGRIIAALIGLDSTNDERNPNDDSHRSQP